MAAPITPVKLLYIPSTNPACLLCKKSPSKRLHCLTKFKSTKENYVRAIEDFTGLVLEKALLDKMYVCETCASKCQMSVNFKEACVDNIRDFEKLHKRQKRLSKTPPSSLKQSVAEQIQSSVEKMKQLNLNGGGAKRSRQKLFVEPANDTTISTLEPSFSKTASILNHDLSTPTALDHISYCKFKATSVRNESNDGADETDIQDLMQTFNEQTVISTTITKSIENVCKAGKSILFLKDPGELSKKNWFRDVSSEMNEKCPELFHILFAAVGMFYFIRKNDF